MKYTTILFYSTSHAIRAEKVLQKTGVQCKLIPVPRQISSNCGVCIRVERVDREVAQQSLEAVGVEIDEIHDV